MVSEATARVGDDDASKKISTLQVNGDGKPEICQLIASAISVRRFLTPFSILLYTCMTIRPNRFEIERTTMFLWTELLLFLMLMWAVSIGHIWLTEWTHNEWQYTWNSLWAWAMPGDTDIGRRQYPGTWVDGRVQDLTWSLGYRCRTLFGWAWLYLTVAIVWWLESMEHLNYACHP